MRRRGREGEGGQGGMRRGGRNAGQVCTHLATCRALTGHFAGHQQGRHIPRRGCPRGAERALA
eukprot:3432840-Pyramimonas_sp.AAC.1